jgi:glucose-6-phosphate isomerase
MHYQHDYRTVLADSVGKQGLSDAELAAALAETTPAIAKLRRRHEDGSLPLLRLPAKHDDLPALEALAGELRRGFDHVAVLGIGGSSLGGQTLCALADLGFGPRPGAPRVHFLDNIDPATFVAFFAAVDLRRTAFLVISKSGGTAEPLTQFAVCLDAVRNAVGRADVGAQFVAVTEPTDNLLRQLAQRYGLRTFDHDPHVGGRFSVLSNVGLLPALVAGLDAAKIRDGAASVLDATLAAQGPRQSEPAVGAALSVALGRYRGVTQTVLMPYVDRLAYFGLWFRQLWAESLGKDG